MIQTTAEEKSFSWHGWVCLIVRFSQRPLKYCKNSLVAVFVHNWLANKSAQSCRCSTVLWKSIFIWDEMHSHGLCQSRSATNEYIDAPNEIQVQGSISTVHGLLPAPHTDRTYTHRHRPVCSAFEIASLSAEIAWNSLRLRSPCGLWCLLQDQWCRLR